MRYLNLAEMFFSKREKYGSYTAYKFKTSGQWKEVTYNEAVDLGEKIAGGFASLGIKKGDRIGIISANRMEWALCDYAALSLGAALVPVYPSLLPEQIQYILNDSSAKILVAADLALVEKINVVQKNLTTVKHYYVFDQDSVEYSTPWDNFNSLIEAGDEFLKKNKTYVLDAIKEVEPEDVATVIYTSGTTGEPKGAVLSHKNFLSNCDSVSQIFDCHPEDEFLSFLPLSHILERTAGHFFPCYSAATVSYAESIDTVAENMQEIKPTLMVSVPRLYEKMYNRILEAVETGPTVKRKLFYWAVNIGREFEKKKMNKQKISASLKYKRDIAFKLVFSKLKARVGGKLRFFVSGGAPLSAEIGEFFNAAGLIILEGYGLTETSPGISFNTPESFRFGTVGHPIPGVEVKIAKDGEILTRGDHVMIGYLNKDEETRAVIDGDGWFYTGDIGFFDDDDFLKITDRKKNIIVTSGGKNIAPQPIENNLITSKYIEQAVVIGDKRKFCSAIIVPAEETIINWAKNEEIQYSNYNELLNNTLFNDLIQSEIERLTEHFASYERIKKFYVTTEPFSQESGELTPTLKVKRNVVEQKYKSDIDKLYVT